MPITCQARHLPVRYGAIDAAHVARRGELIVPPGDYSRGLLPLDPHQANAGLTGRVIYDAALLDVEGDGLEFEVRTYGPSDLTRPQTSETLSFPATDKVVQLRQLQLAIYTVKGTSVSYRVSFAPAGLSAATPPSETEDVPNECRGDVPEVDVAPAKE